MDWGFKMKKLFILMFMTILLIGIINATITVNLNSPSDASITLNPVITNFSANSSGDYLVNLTQYDNSTGSWEAKNTTILSTILLIENLTAINATTSWAIYKTFIVNTYINNSNNTLTSTGFNHNITVTYQFMYNDTTQANVSKYYNNEVGTSINQYINPNPTKNVTTINVWAKWTSDPSPNQIKAFSNDRIYSFILNNTETLKNSYILGSTILWNGLYCTVSGTCSFAPTNYTFYIPFVENSNTFNSTTFETLSETFTINLTANSSLTAVSLNYNGTLYPMTNQGLGIWSKTLGITSAMVGTQSFNYKYTYGGNNYYSENQTQVVNPLVFVNCNSTYATKFINFTFKDENTLNILNGTIPYSEFVYYLGDGTINKTYTFTNTTTNISSFTFCSNAINSTLKVNPTIQYIATSYPQRIYQPSTLTLTNVTTNKSLYLLGVSDGIFVTYQVLTTSNQPIEGVDVVSTRTILGEEVVIGVGQTDASGIVTFWENPDFQHSTTFSKTGYDSYVFNHFPTRSEYTISLGEQVEIPKSLTRGISFVILPKKTFLYENTINTFSLSLSSNYNDLEEFGFSLTYSNGTLIGSNISTSALGGTITLQNINISTTKNITMVSYYVIDGKTTLLNPTYWIIQTLDGTQYSIKNLFNEFDAYSSSDFWGFGDFERIILSILILILMVGGLSRRYGIANEATITSMIFGVVALLDVVLEFIPEITIPATGVTLPQGTLTAITFLILIVLLIMEER
jgi:hypothetical protein